MNKVTIYGQIFGSSGYSSHTRQLINALNEIGVDVKLNTQLIPNWLLQVNDSELNMITKEDSKDRIAICINLPSSWYQSMTQNYKKFYGFLIFEGDKIPKSWCEILMDKKVDGILVPSQHTKNAILNTINCEEIKNKIHIIPHGVDLSKFKKIEIEPQLKDNKFTLICNSGWRSGINDRKGVQYLLRAFCEEFNNEDNVKLILHINPAYLPPNWDFYSECKKIGINLNEKTPRILVNTSLMNYKDLNKMYNMGDIFICTQMADGFNIPGLEAMACGLPTIQCCFGGQTDYMTDENSWVISKGEMVEVDWDIFYEGINWFKPDIKEIRQVIRYVYNHQEEVKQKGQQALLDVNKFTWRNTALKLNQIL